MEEGGICVCGNVLFGEHAGTEGVTRDILVL